MLIFCISHNYIYHMCAYNTIIYIKFHTGFYLQNSHAPSKQTKLVLPKNYVHTSHSVKLLLITKVVILLEPFLAQR
jgi:hypothetical protein